MKSLKRHMHRVAELSRALGQGIGLAGDELQLLQIAAGYHDLGKMYLPDKTVLKKHRLTAAEQALIRRHADIGADMLSRYGLDDSVVEAVRHHHEWWNGQGYPGKLNGEEIPLFARIIAVADAYEAMTAGRVYKKAVSPAEAFSELGRYGGIQFDPELVKMFTAICREENGRDV